MSQSPEPTKQSSFRAYDDILRRWFKAETQALLATLMNQPRIINWRISKQRQQEEGMVLNMKHGWEIIHAATIKRRRKNYHRRHLAHRGAFTYSYLQEAPKAA